LKSSDSWTNNLDEHDPHIDLDRARPPNVRM
jgi:hypothetical protein